MPRFTEPIRVLIADPDRLFAELLAERLGREPDIVATGTAATAAELRLLALATDPHVVLCESHLPDGDAFESADELARLGLDARLVLLTGVVADVLVAQALRVGTGYLLKTESVTGLVAAVRRSAAGEYSMSAEVEARLTFEPSLGRLVLKADRHLAGLTQRQVEVLRHLARGRSVREVADALGLTEKGVESHKYRIGNRLGVRGRVAMARYAIREGILPP